MLPRNLRLPATEIPLLARKGKRFSNDLVELRVWYDEQLTTPQFAIVTSKKLSPKATVRNLIRRRVRAAVADLVKAGSFKPAKYLILCRSLSLEEIEFTTLIDSLTLLTKNL
jgi:ribonuclease P protein component